MRQSYRTYSDKVIGEYKLRRIALKFETTRNGEHVRCYRCGEKVFKGDPVDFHIDSKHIFHPRGKCPSSDTGVRDAYQPRTNGTDSDGFMDGLAFLRGDTPSIDERVEAGEPVSLTEIIEEQQAEQRPELDDRYKPTPRRRSAEDIIAKLMRGK